MALYAIDYRGTICYCIYWGWINNILSHTAPLHRQIRAAFATLSTSILLLLLVNKRLQSSATTIGKQLKKKLLLPRVRGKKHFGKIDLVLDALFF